ncbi:ATP-binding cassette, subfamily C, CydD [Paenibacillus algorifonticola]|uniref:ATP-binding cassette, subfamily C, CydD n=1 Tax=Paenibacillus algorifonticola TaxID=684063 RepID=A0A1I1YX19_9BACL|nr:thiol reductant ABC exporter subunit CydD [Paenibacillus algorifonticola]SFE24125.1 ATP-binding cassette, subfamily C, CydD [Paenibacillus algorifonticola]
MDRAWFQLKGIQLHMLLLTVLSLLQGAAIIGQATFLAKAITLLFENKPLDQATQPLLLFLISFVARHTFVWLQRRLSGGFAEKTAEVIRQQLLVAIFGHGPSFAAKQGSGRLVTLVLDGVDRFRTYLELSISRMIDMLCVTVLLLLWVYRLDMISGIILMCTLPILIGFFILLGFAARKQADKQWRAHRMLSHHFTDSLRGLLTLRFLKRSRAHSETVGNVSNQYRVSTMRTLRVAFLSSFALDFFSMLSVAFVAVGLGIRLVNGNLGLEVALAVLLIAPEYFTPIKLLGTDYHASLDGKEAWGTIRSIVSSKKQPEQEQEDKPACILAEQKEELTMELSSIQVAGEAGTFLLKEVSIQLPQNVTRIGIVGASGAGKTTLLGLLSGFIEPDGGDFWVNNVRMSGSVREEWRRQVAYIPQHPHLFSQSLTDNVRFYAPDATREQVEGVIDAVGLRSLVDQLQGSDSKIGEGGRVLSGGQAQRVALARALLSSRPVILLDEPTAHLDIETEYELKQMMLTILKERKVFMATHRLHWMPEMEFILVLEQGNLAESGTHEQLMEQQGVYYNLMIQGLGEGEANGYEGG